MHKITRTSWVCSVNTHARAAETDNAGHELRQFQRDQKPGRQRHSSACVLKEQMSCSGDLVTLAPGALQNRGVTGLANADHIRAQPFAQGSAIVQTDAPRRRG